MSRTVGLTDEVIKKRAEAAKQAEKEAAEAAKQAEKEGGANG
jgi:hypothetical protein